MSHVVESRYSHYVVTLLKQLNCAMLISISYKTS